MRGGGSVAGHNLDEPCSFQVVWIARGALTFIRFTPVVRNLCKAIREDGGEYLLAKRWLMSVAMLPTTGRLLDSGGL